MKHKLSENRALGVTALCCAILVGVLGIGCAKVRAVAQAPADYYRTSMSADFAAREAAAGSLLALAEGNVDDSLLQSAQAALDESCAAADDPAARYAAGLSLKTAVELLYNAMPADERDGQGSPAQMAWSEFTSRTAILSHAVPEYNELARTAAQKLSGFPAQLLADLAGAHTEEMTA